MGSPRRPVGPDQQSWSSGVLGKTTAIAGGGDAGAAVSID
jgi:hypothetical protein